MQIFEMFGTVLLKDQGVNSKLDSIDKKAGSTSRNMGLSFGSIAKAALGVATVLGAGMGIKGMLDAASSGQKTMAQMDAVLKSTGGAAGMTKQALTDLAAAQAKVTTFSAGTTKAAENLLLTFTGISSKTFPDTIKAAQNMSTAMGTDLNSSVMTLGKALNDPAAGLSKLTKQGVTFTAAQKEQITAMQKAGDTAGAQKVILAELSKEFGGSAEAAGGTFAGQLKILQNQITGVGASIMTNVMPYITGFITTINNNMPKIKQVVTDVINAIVPRFQAWIKLIGQIVTELFPGFGKQIDGVKGKASGFTSVLDGVTGVLTFVKNNIGLVKTAVVGITAAMVAWKAITLITKAAQEAHNAILLISALRSGGAAAATLALNGSKAVEATVTGSATVAQWLYNAAMAAGLLPILAIVAGVALLAVGVYEIIKHWGQIVPFFQNIWKSITKFFAPIGKWFSDVFSAAWNGIKTAFSAVGSFFSGIWNGITGVFGAVGKWFSDVFTGAWNGVVSVFNGFVDFIKKWGLTILAVIFWPFSLAAGLIIKNWSTISAFFQGVWNGIKAVFSVVVSFFKSIWDGIVVVFTPVVNFYTAIFTTAWNVIKSVWSAVVGFFKGVWDGIVKIFNAVVGFYVGIFTTAWNGIKAVWNAVTGFFQDIWSSIIKIFSPIVSWFGEIFQRAWNGIKSVFSSVGSFFSGVFNTIKGIFTKIGTTVGNAIGGAFKAVVNSIIGFAEGMINGFIRGINGAIGLINNIPGVHIPSVGTLNIPKMNVGTRYLPNDMLLQAHKGEMIVPKSENPYANSGGGATLPQGGGGDLVLNVAVGDNPVKTVRYASQQIAQAQRQRTSFKAVTA